MVTLCICDGPRHHYDPGWCREGRAPDGQPINKIMAATRLELQAARLRAQAAAETAAEAATATCAQLETMLGLMHGGKHEEI